MQTAAHSNHSYIQLQTLQEQHKYFEREREKKKKERKKRKEKKKENTFFLRKCDTNNMKMKPKLSVPNWAYCNQIFEHQVH